MLSIALTGISLIIVLVALSINEIISEPVAAYSSLGIIVVLCLTATLRKLLKR